MSFKPNEEPKAFLIWNRRHLTPTTIVGKESQTPTTVVEGLTHLNFMRAAELPEYSPLLAGDFMPIAQTTELDELEEMGRTDAAVPEHPVYNIIQNKLNLSEKRGPKFTCRECRYAVHTRLSMVTHMKTHLKPFCEVCFNSFESQGAVHDHIQSIHPEVVIRERTPTPSSRDFYCLQTVAPPNTPNPMSDDEMSAIEELLNPIVKMPVNVAVAQKLLGGTEDTDGGLSTEDEQRLVIDDRAVPGTSRGRPRKKSTLKRPIAKKQKKTKLKDVSSTPDNVMKKITSRFGRCISLKLPQF